MLSLAVKNIFGGRYWEYQLPSNILNIVVNLLRLVIADPRRRGASQKVFNQANTNVEPLLLIKCMINECNSNSIKYIISILRSSFCRGTNNLRKILSRWQRRSARQVGIMSGTNQDGHLSIAQYMWQSVAIDAISSSFIDVMLRFRMFYL